jgi:hypothetical protein
MICRTLACSPIIAAAFLSGCGGGSERQLSDDDMKRRDVQRAAIQESEEAQAKSIQSGTGSKGALPKSVKGRVLSAPLNP